MGSGNQPLVERPRSHQFLVASFCLLLWLATLPEPWKTAFYQPLAIGKHLNKNINDPGKKRIAVPTPSFQAGRRPKNL
jgi:hypothetical protein